MIRLDSLCISTRYTTSGLRLCHEALEDAPSDKLAIDDDYAERMADADLVRRLLAQLPEEDCEIVRMKYLEGYSNKEIAQSLGMNPSTVSTRVQRSLEKMRLALE